MISLKKHHNIDNYLITLIFSVIFITSLGLFCSPILRGNDAYSYAIIAKEIFYSNDWMNLIYRGQDWLDKPHFQFWMTAISYKIFGVNTFAYILPGFIFNLIGAFYTFILGRHLFKSRTIGLFSALFYLTALHLLLDTINIKQEAYLLGTIIPACYYWCLYHESHTIKNKYLLYGAIFTACAMMTKGIFVLCPIFSGLIILWICQKKKPDIFKWFLAGLLSMIFILPELIALYIQFDLHPEKIVFGQTDVSGLFWFFIGSQFGRFFNIGSIVQTGHQGIGHYFYFFHVFLWAYLPWIVMLPFAIWKAIKQNILKNFGIIYLLGSFIPTFVLFSLTEFQLDHYTNILIPFAAIICAWWALNAQIVARHFILVVILPSVLMCVISILLLVQYAYVSKFDDGYQISQYLKDKSALPIIDYKIRSNSLLFFSQQDQYNYTDSEKMLFEQKEPYYLVTTAEDWKGIASNLEKQHGISFLQQFEVLPKGTRILLKFVNMKKYMKDVVLIKVQ